MPELKKDFYANRALDVLTMSAANTITFGQLRFGVGLFQGIGLVVHRVEYYPDAGALQEIVAAADALQMGLTTRDDLPDLNPDSLNVICVKTLTIRLVGAVVGILSDEHPIVQSFTDLPGGGLILPANPIFFCLSTAGFAAPATCRLVVYFTFKTLSDKDYLELLQSMVPANI